MSPPDHESMFHSFLHATPLGGDEWQAAGLASTPGGGPGQPLARLPSDPACITPASLVSLVRDMELTPAENKGAMATDGEKGEFGRWGVGGEVGFVSGVCEVRWYGCMVG